MKCPVCKNNENNLNTYKWYCKGCGTPLKQGIDTILSGLFFLIPIFYFIFTNGYDNFENLNRNIERVLIYLLVFGFFGFLDRFIWVGEVDKKVIDKSNPTDDSQKDDSSHQENEMNDDYNKDLSSKKEKMYGKFLNLKGNVNFDDIHKAYKLKIKEYHPDKVDSMGDELKKLAEEKTKEINEAYNFFVKRYK
jgi:hypothetical protein